MRYVENDRDSKPSMLRDYRSVVESRLLPAFADVRVDEMMRAVPGGAVDHQ